MSKRYSAFSLAWEGLTGQTGWRPAWRNPKPKAAYEVIVIGGGGHGLATAYYLAKRHGVRNVAVIEKSYIGGGNTGRNTTVVRSNYFYPESVALYDLALRLYEGLSRELNFNVMLSQRGIINVAHSDAEMEISARLANAMQINGVDAELFGPEDVRRVAPALNFDPKSRYPVFGGVWHGRGGTVRHDAVAWGFARGADTLGVDILQNLEVEDFLIEGGVCKGVITAAGPIRAERVGLAAAAHSALLAAKAGFELPMRVYTLQAMVSESVKPVLDTVVLIQGSGTYVSQTDKGELLFGGGIDRVTSFARRGNTPVHEGIVAGLIEAFPAFGQLKLMRQWAGVVDVVPDSSPLIGLTPVPNLFINCGWGTGGFKAIPAGGFLLAHLLAKGEHHEISRPFDLDRFQRGALIDEAAGSGIAH
jgi:sarcosine oxidase subunit beta